MPQPDRDIRWPSWVEALGDLRLEMAVKEALAARDLAERTRETNCATFRAAEKALHEIAIGSVKGRAALKNAAAAIRKFDAAGVPDR